MTPEGVEQRKHEIKALAKSHPAKPTMTPEGVEQIIARTERRSAAIAKPTMTPEGVEQSFADSARARRSQRNRR